MYFIARSTVEAALLLAPDSRATRPRLVDALFIGVIVGTYSSLVVAAPVFLWVNKRFYAGRGHLISIDREEREGTGTLLGAAAAAGQGPARENKADDDAGPDDEPPPPTEKKTRRRRRRRPES